MLLRRGVEDVEPEEHIHPRPLVRVRRRWTRHRMSGNDTAEGRTLRGRLERCTSTRRRISQGPDVRLRLSLTREATKKMAEAVGSISLARSPQDGIVNFGRNRNENQLSTDAVPMEYRWGTEETRTAKSVSQSVSTTLLPNRASTWLLTVQRQGPQRERRSLSLCDKAETTRGTDSGSLLVFSRASAVVP